MDHFEARILRYKRNEANLVKLVKEVIKSDSDIEVYVHKDCRFIDSVVFFKGEEFNSISFHDVPYRWSGCGYKEHNGSNHNLEMPFSINDVINTFKPVSSILLRQPNEYFKSKDQYLKWCSYLKKIDYGSISEF